MNGVNAEIIAVGSELLTPSKVDTNSLWLTDSLNTLGVEVVQKSVIGDDRERLTEAMRGAMARVRLVFITGGLGPTEDDVTRDATAAALARGQVFRQDLCDLIESRFRRMGRHMVENNKRQAYVLEGAEILPNDRGTAAGQWIDSDGSSMILLPGPPRELKAMFETQCLPRLRAILPQASIFSRCYRVSCMPESDLDQLIAPVYTRYSNPATTVLAGAGDIQVYLRARCASEGEAESLVNEVGSQIEEVLGDRVYTRNGSSLEQTVGDLLTSTSGTLAVADSATGGMLAERITSVPGSSRYFLGGFLTYSDVLKSSLLDVSPALLASGGAVSEPV
ncbi:MAG TPA: CinA family nicotinamide mononucleotide deamidase-related protein, partial [Bryobacteraceae bacterium]|nr:CinA family nicotinamide mononucleotide deamidase-related protein [Bryobacteraceae bacterium]